MESQAGQRLKHTAKSLVDGPMKSTNVSLKVSLMLCKATLLILTYIVMVGIALYDKDWKKVTKHVGTRISAQVRSHAQKVLKDYSPNSHLRKKERALELKAQMAAQQ